jgi:hypothetical protein
MRRWACGCIFTLSERRNRLARNGLVQAEGDFGAGQCTIEIGVACSILSQTNNLGLADSLPLGRTEFFWSVRPGGEVPRDRLIMGSSLRELRSFLAP